MWQARNRRRSGGAGGRKGEQGQTGASRSLGGLTARWVLRLTLLSGTRGAMLTCEATQQPNGRKVRILRLAREIGSGGLASTRTLHGRKAGSHGLRGLKVQLGDMQISKDSRCLVTTEAKHIGDARSPCKRKKK